MDYHQFSVIIDLDHIRGLPVLRMIHLCCKNYRYNLKDRENILLLSDFIASINESQNEVNDQKIIFERQQIFFKR